MAEPAKTRWVTFELGFFESQILLQSLRVISRNYRIKPEEADAKTAAVWYSTRGCQTSGMSGEDTAEWLAHLHQIKQANLEPVERWILALSQKKSDRCRMRIKLEEAAGFLAVLNDHRLFLAARHDIGEAEMNMRNLGQFRLLPPHQQTAVLEMELMGMVIEQVIGKLSM